VPLSAENVVSGLYLHGGSGEQLVEEEPAIWNIPYFLIKKRIAQNSLQMIVHG
jgi:hypothetical protein